MDILGELAPVAPVELRHVSKRFEDRRCCRFGSYEGDFAGWFVRTLSEDVACRARRREDGPKARPQWRRCAARARRS